MKQYPLDLSISIVSYNTKDLLRKCLKSIFSKTKKLKFEIYVVDNDSKDGSVEMVAEEFPQVKLIANKTNNFYTKANNQSLSRAKGKYFLILNCDTFFIDDSLEKMVDYLEKNPKVGAIEGLQLYLDQSPVPTGGNQSSPLLDFYTLSWVGNKIANQRKVANFRLEGKDRRLTFPAEVICDAFLMTRTDLFKDMGGYDENLLLYYTENDLCLRIINKGFKTIHFGRGKVMHSVNASSKKLGRKKINKIYLQDLLKYYTKWGKGLAGRLLYWDLKIEYWLLERLKPSFR